MYSLSFSFTLIISPSGEVFYHQVTIEHSIEYAGEKSEFITIYSLIVYMFNYMLNSSPKT